MKSEIESRGHWAQFSDDRLRDEMQGALRFLEAGIRQGVAEPGVEHIGPLAIVPIVPAALERFGDEISQVEHVNAARRWPLARGSIVLRTYRGGAKISPVSSKPG